MKETIVKINKTKSWFFKKIKRIDKPLVRLIKKKKKIVKSTKLEMSKERLQQTILSRNTKDYKRLLDNYMAKKWITWKKWTDS